MVPPLTLDQCNRQVIESALFAPQTSFGGADKYPELDSKTAALLYALAKSQACADGNKRIALILVMEFLALNGATLAWDGDTLADTILETAESHPATREQTVATLTDRLRNAIVPLEDG